MARCVISEFDLAQSPALVEEWFERAVEAQDRKPALTRQRLDPVAPIGGAAVAEPVAVTDTSRVRMP